MKAAITPAMLRMVEGFHRLPPKERKATTRRFLQVPKFVVDGVSLFQWMRDHYGCYEPEPPEDLRPPYDMMVMEVNYREAAIVVLLADFDGEFTAVCNVWNGDELTGATGFRLKGIRGRPFPPQDAGDPEIDQELAELVRVEISKLLLLLCTPDLPVEHAGRAMNGRGSGVRRDRISYINLVRRSRRKRDHLGGSHSSPVGHMRRRHERTLPSGRKIWVRSTTVNGGSIDALSIYEHRPNKARDDIIVEIEDA